MNVSIVGYGAIGGLLITRCLEHGISFDILARESQRIDLTLEPMNKPSYNLGIETHQLGPTQIQDVVIVPVKAYQVRSVLSQLQPLISQNTCIVLLHNGMGSIEIIHDEFPYQPAILATTSHGAYKPSNNHVIQTGIG